jgi:ATP-binding cassette subfamily B protein
MYLLFKTILKSAFGYGTMLALYNSVQRLRSHLQRFSYTIPEFEQHSLYIDKIRKFLDYEVKIKNKESTLSMPKDVASLELKNISFAYNDKDSYILKNIDLIIKPGEKIAFVGYNGAGKTTLIKLLLRLYDPMVGEILYNGVKIKDYDIKEYHNSFGTVFQDFQLFSATFGQNIIMDNVKLDNTKALEALEQSELNEKFIQLINGFDSQDY